ncbi:MAG TPA: lysophospholipid acyltransferase family protein [Ramlibacter sp.]|uniref:lysophospholipid acyltransferase family protein n=1 Tax=Ramlibacter sp. TaxID=1917967 RepID=UPI002B8533CD|nr:lysophospholipid acyltransferase family protein [Ramlibacter sp.]HVZ42373.1 lysophospholipid acyltransferase family protein [Ramlibacter sp.]
MKLLFRSLARWPLFLLHLLGAAAGWSAFLLSPTYRRRFLGNVRQAGFRFSDVRRAVGEAGRMALEIPRLWLGAPVAVNWEGDRLIEEALAVRRGILFLTPHLGCFEITARAYAERFGPITVLYRPHRKAWLRDLAETARRGGHLDTVPATLAGVRRMLRVLKDGGVVGLLPDQVPPEGFGAWAPFFGRDAYTMTLPSRLALQTGALLLAAWGERLPRGAGYRIHLRPWPDALARDPAAAAAQVNAGMERLVRERPEQYLWGYARYKTPRHETAP